MACFDRSLKLTEAVGRSESGQPACWGLLSDAVVSSRFVGYSRESELCLEWDKNFGLRKERQLLRGALRLGLQQVRLAVYVLFMG